MTPPTFQIGDEVLITGPSIMDCKFHIGKRFTIEQIDRDKYSSYGLPYYPASSLQLVNKKPLSPMQITYNYKPDNCKHGTFHVSCPCGRKADIVLPEKSKWEEVPTELKIGDYVKVVEKPARVSCEYHMGEISHITEIRNGEYEVFGWWFKAPSLRKLTPDEVKQHTDTIGYQMQECQATLDKAEEALRRVLAPLVDKRLSAIEKQLEEQQKSMDNWIAEAFRQFHDYQDKTDARLAFIEQFQRDQDDPIGRAIRDEVAEILDFRRKA